MARAPMRRDFLKQTAAAATAFVGISLRDDWPDCLARANAVAAGRTPRELAGDDFPVAGPGEGGRGAGESYWSHIEQAYDVDRSMINLNNGGVAPSPRFVHDALVRQLAITNNCPPRQLWTMQDPQIELVRTRLARVFGCDPGEMAITRNASESLQICLNGIDMKPGDEFLTTNHDYPRMIQTIRQRELRDRIRLVQLKLPVPVDSDDAIVDLFAKHITSRTRVILVSHIVNVTGEILPVQRICALARERGILAIVDGAHAFAHFVFNGRDLGADFYATSLHKWLSAPIGTGFLYVRRERIKDLWPLTAPADPKSDDIRKFEEIGTHPSAPRMAIAEAVTFFEGIGPARKEARLRFLRDYWVDRLKGSDRIRIYTNLSPAHSCAIATVEIVGIDSQKLFAHLWEKHKILTTPIVHEDFTGIRVTPNTYTTRAELDIFVDAMRDVIRNGIPNEG
ncbi:MAG: aminotransferase class V-fold PLP-dependent enzyme [Phycisphaerae bacterium]|nr:aminotransferase class V-fold PLP-dependent enzyme [Phycisphaerae bacterium]